jgi:hypothetical protein
MSESIKDGQAAKQVLENPALQNALNVIENELVEHWKVCSSPELREEIWYTLKGHERFVSTLKTTVEIGEMDKALMEKYNGK